MRSAQTAGGARCAAIASAAAGLVALDRKEKLVQRADRLGQAVVGRGGSAAAVEAELPDAGLTEQPAELDPERLVVLGELVAGRVRADPWAGLEASLERGPGDRRASPDAVVAEDDPARAVARSEEHTSELQSRQYLVCRLLL